MHRGGGSRRKPTREQKLNFGERVYRGANSARPLSAYYNASKKRRKPKGSTFNKKTGGAPGSDIWWGA